MQLLVDVHISIKSLDIDWQQFPANAKNGSQIEADDYAMKPMVTDITDVVTDVLPMVTNVYPMVAEESSCKN